MYKKKSMLLTICVLITSLSLLPVRKTKTKAPIRKTISKTPIKKTKSKTTGRETITKAPENKKSSDITISSGQKDIIHTRVTIQNMTGSGKTGYTIYISADGNYKTSKYGGGFERRSAPKTLTIGETTILLDIWGKKDKKIAFRWSTKDSDNWYETDYTPIENLKKIKTIYVYDKGVYAYGNHTDKKQANQLKLITPKEKQQYEIAQKIAEREPRKKLAKKTKPIKMLLWGFGRNIVVTNNTGKKIYACVDGTYKQGHETRLSAKAIKNTKQYKFSSWVPKKEKIATRWTYEADKEKASWYETEYFDAAAKIELLPNGKYKINGTKKQANIVLFLLKGKPPVPSQKERPSRPPKKDRPPIKKTEPIEIKAPEPEVEIPETAQPEDEDDDEIPQAPELSPDDLEIKKTPTKPTVKKPKKPSDEKPSAMDELKKALEARKKAMQGDEEEQDEENQEEEKTTITKPSKTTEETIEGEESDEPPEAPAFSPDQFKVTKKPKKPTEEKKKPEQPEVKKPSMQDLLEQMKKQAAERKKQMQEETEEVQPSETDW